jgi:ribonuclease Z
VFAYLTDTAFCEPSVALAAGADLVVHEATYAGEESEMGAERLHSSAKDAAEVARRAQARRLVLTHFSPRYEDASLHLADARAVFAETEAAEDFASFEIPRRRADQSGG